MSVNKNENTNTKSKESIAERVKEVWDSTTSKISEKSEIAVEKMKELVGMEIIDDPQHIKERANKMNPEQAQNKDSMQRELTEQQKEHPPVPIQKEHNERTDFIERAETLNKEQAERKEEMQKELTKENKEIPAFDNKPTTMEKVKETFSSANMNEAKEKVKEVWGTTTDKLLETSVQIQQKTGTAVEKMKEWTGMENKNPEHIKKKAAKMNPEQAQMKQEMQRELTENNKEAEAIRLNNDQIHDLQNQNKEKMQKELKKENKPIPAFDEKATATDKMKATWDKTTSKIAEKGEIAVDKMKEWTGTKDEKENVQQIKDKAVKMNPEQAQMKQEMQKELKKEHNNNENKEEHKSDVKEVRNFALEQKGGMNEASFIPHHQF